MMSVIRFLFWWCVVSVIAGVIFGALSWIRNGRKCDYPDVPMFLDDPPWMEKARDHDKDYKEKLNGN